MAVQRDPLYSEPHLTALEREILELVAIGQSAKEIAIGISIAPRTVERHIENIRRKLNARNRAHLVTQAICLGILTIEGPVAVNDMPLLI